MSKTKRSAGSSPESFGLYVGIFLWCHMGLLSVCVSVLQLLLCRSMKFTVDYSPPDNLSLS